MELKLNNNDRLNFTWIKPDMLAIELHRPMNLRDGHGVVLAASTYLSGDDLNALLAFLVPDQQEAAMKTGKRLDRIELALMSPLEREIATLLLQLYRTHKPNPALLEDLLLLSRIKRMNDAELATYVRNEYAQLTQEQEPCA